MYSLTDLCSLCLVHSKSIKSILSEDSDGVSVKNKIEFIITEVTNFKSEVISNICTDCLTGLNYVYKFKQKCLQNFTTLNAYVEQMASKNEEFNYSASTSTIENHFMTNITENYAVKEEPKDSDDNMENNDNSSLFTQTFEESTMKDETKSTAMSNNAEYIEGQSSVSKNRVPENNEEPVIVKQELGYIQDEVDTKDDPLLPDDDDTEEMPDEATNNSETATESSPSQLALKSRKRYKFTYDQFLNWLKEKKIDSSFSEVVLLDYFNEQSKKVSPNSLWTMYSMLRTTISMHQKIDISQYTKLKKFLKYLADGYTPKKTLSLSTNDIYKFLSAAPDDKYLLTKIILIIGITGACKKHELAQLKIENFEDLGSAVIIRIPDNKTKKNRTFTITGKFYDIYKKYASARPEGVTQNRFFLNWQRQKCTRVPVGINKIGNVPKQVATFLHLKEPELYTGHCFRRSSALF